MRDPNVTTPIARCILHQTADPDRELMSRKHTATRQSPSAVNPPLPVRCLLLPVHVPMPPPWLLLDFLSEVAVSLVSGFRLLYPTTSALTSRPMSRPRPRERPAFSRCPGTRETLSLSPRVPLVWAIYVVWLAPQPPRRKFRACDVACVGLSCLLALYAAVMSFEILFPFGLWVFEPSWD